MNPNQLIEDLFRREYSKIVATLTRLFGFEHLDMIEDVVQDAFTKAVGIWREEIPQNPSAWLMRVAKNKAIDILRRNATLARKINNGDLQGPIVTQVDQLFLEHEIADSQMRLLLMCCHPSLKLQDQIALNLKIVCGFGRKEIARALLTTEENIKKRLHRARKKIQQNNIQLEMPDKREVGVRLQAALQVIYLIFNEGYHSTKTDQIIQKDLCLEAMRLCKILYDHPSFEDTSIQALMALMCFHAARFDSRIDPKNNQIILMKDQDRSKWDEQLVKVGTHFYREAWKTKDYTNYHIEAAIAMEYYVAPEYEQTNWGKILKLYEWLEKHNNSPMIHLNKMIILMEMGRISEAMKLGQSVDPKEFKGRLHLYHTVMAVLYKVVDDDGKEVGYHLQRAVEHAPTSIEKKLLEDKLSAYSNPAVYN